MRNKLRGKRKYIFFFLLLVGLIFASFILYLQFKLKTVIIISSFDKLNGISIFNDKNLLTLDTDGFTYFLQKQNTFLKSLSLEKKFPHTIVISANDRIPVAKISNNLGNSYVDGDGVIFANEEIFNNLPVINAQELTIITEKADWRIIKAIAFIESINKQSINIEQISTVDSANSFLVKLTDGIEVSIPYDADVAAKASSLQLVVLRFRIEGKKITRIDFSFDKPIVTFATGEKISSTLPAQGLKD